MSRLDHNFNPKQQLYVRYSFKNAFYTEYNNAGIVAPANNFLPNDGATNRIAASWFPITMRLLRTLLNEFRFGFTNYNENDTFPIQGRRGHFSTRADLRSCGKHCLASHGGCLPDLQFRRRHHYQHRAGPGWTNHFGEHRNSPTIVTTIMGKHTLRFGIDARREHYNALMYFLPSDDYGNFTFSGSLTGYSFGDFLLGLANPSYFAVTGPQMDARTVQWGAYGQDAWQVNSHLTVNFGLRWELLPPFQETNGDIATYLTTREQLDRRRSGQIL